MVLGGAYVSIRGKPASLAQSFTALRESSGPTGRTGF